MANAITVQRAIHQPFILIDYVNKLNAEIIQKQKQFVPVFDSSAKHFKTHRFFSALYV